MRLSVIIVSYNVFPFLDNCLRSVQQAMTGIEGEIIIVDNASVDRTTQLLEQNFPDVVIIANRENKGFAKANNQGISIAKGEFIVLLNPDTIVSENTFTTCLHFMDAHPEAGALGVKMVDGSGRYLPESKRGLPTLRSSFMKMTGLYKLFPKSATWNSYYQGQINENETAKIEVLSGAFMFLRKTVLEKTGLLDEAFFMYGEDIDLSYRITKAGYSIYYVPTTTIIHYKGESTRKSSLNYILTFYQAMLTFTQKHAEFKGQQSLIKLAIYLHGFIQFLKQSINKWWPVVIDALAFGVIFFVVSKFWASYYFHHPDYFTPSFYYFNIPLYTIITLLSLFLNGAYDQPYTKKQSLIGFAWGSLAILVMYAILPSQFRSSRMIILMGCVVFLIWLLISRFKFYPWKRDSKNQQPDERKTIIVAGLPESNRIKELINRSRDHLDIVGTIHPGNNHQEYTGEFGDLSQLSDIVRVHKIREIIFSAQDVPFSTFTSTMTELGPDIRYMLAASGTMNIVGSMNKDTEGESYAIRVDFQLTHPSVKRSKRIFDFIASICLLILYPLMALIVPHAGRFAENIFSVLSGRKTWVTYYPAETPDHSLPKLKEGIISPGYPRGEEDPFRRLQHIHYVYARDYHWTTDLAVMTSQLKNLGQKNPANAG